MPDVKFWLALICMALDNRDHLREIIDSIVKGRVDANRRYIDEVLEKIQDQNHRFYLEKLATEVMHLEQEEKKSGNLQVILHHRVMVDVYKALLEKTFGP